MTYNPLLPDQTRRDLWNTVTATVEDYIKRIADHPVAPELDPTDLRKALASYDFETARTLDEVYRFVVESLRKHHMHVSHPRYFGLFNPAPTAISIAADTLVAAFNPQLAAWGHSPCAVEIERHLIQQIGSRFGLPDNLIDGTFCSGGAEANHTAVLTALNHAFPGYGTHGLRDTRPAIYVSSEGHHSIAKAARVTGIGLDAVRELSTGDDLRMDLDVLRRSVQQDRSDRMTPFMVVATAGSTNSGTVDPLADIAEFCKSENLWFHADAAWGGSAILSPALRNVLQGIEHADSITFDAHKWMSVPMGAGMFFTRHPDILERTFRIDTGYMPLEGAEYDIQHPFMRSLQWSRRFIGLKVFMSLAVAGWDGYAGIIEEQAGLSEKLRASLRDNGWAIVNSTTLPVVCFQDASHPKGTTDSYLKHVCDCVVKSGQAWISTTNLRGQTVLRACITNYRTTERDVDMLVVLLTEARKSYQP